MSVSLTRSARVAVVLAASAVAVAGLSACSSSSGKKVYVVGYSVPAPAYTALGDAFAKTSQGKGVSLSPTFGPSGTEAKAVADGQKADVVNFSTPGDLTALVPDKVDAGWDQGPTKGYITKSVVVIVVRKGNPLGIKGWDDLIKPGVEIVTPVPSTSGSAKWNILAAYEHVIADGGTADQADAYLKSFLANVTSRPASGSEATQQFTNGTGNVLISYESEAILAKQAGKSIDYIVPPETVLIENPAAATNSASAQGKAFLNYAESEAGQEIFASKGFRPALAGAKIGPVDGANNPQDPFPTPAHLITVESLGGWDKVNDQFFGDSGISTSLGA